MLQFYRCHNPVLSLKAYQHYKYNYILIVSKTLSKGLINTRGQAFSRKSRCETISGKSRLLPRHPRLALHGTTMDI